MDDVVWRLVPAPRAEAELVALVEAVSGAPARLGRHCSRCGSADHGRPFVVGGGPAVSLARADGHALVAIGSGPLGVDLERPGAVPAESVSAADLALDDDPTRTWVRAEAVGKARGTGLGAVDDDGLVVTDLELGPHWVAALASAVAHRTENWSPAQEVP